jgi:hypothetical protein
MNGFAIAAALSAVTVVVLLVVSVTWGRTYLELRTPLALGLVLFSLVLLVENSAALYFYFVADARYYVDEPTIGALIAVLRGLQLLAVGAFAYVSLR